MSLYAREQLSGLISIMLQIWSGQDPSFRSDPLEYRRIVSPHAEHMSVAAQKPRVHHVHAILQAGRTKW